MHTLNSHSFQNARGGEDSYITHVNLFLEPFRQYGQWTIKEANPWTTFIPPGELLPPQGWKIHLTITPGSGIDFLKRVVPILAEFNTVFKVASGLEQHEYLCSSRVDRSTGGKIVTAYPKTASACQQLLDTLHKATTGFYGPHILSDHRYQDSNCVFYRYGGFLKNSTLNTEGSYQHSLISPAEGFIRDERKPWPLRPEWVKGIVDSDGSDVTRKNSPTREVLLNERFLVTEALRHSFKGGVYSGQDKDTGKAVVIKQARPFTGADRYGNDSRDWLRCEASWLRELSSIAACPGYVDDFVYQGDSFLVTDFIDGSNLRLWSQAFESESGSPRPVQQICSVFMRIAECLISVHNHGVVLRDFNPGNIMIDVDGNPILIDLEFASRLGESNRPIYTPGYSAPELVAAKDYIECSDTSVDSYGFGMSLFRCATGIEPIFVTDEEKSLRSAIERVSIFLEAVSAEGTELHGLDHLVLDLIQESPENRIGLEEALTRLQSIKTQVETRSENSVDRPPLTARPDFRCDNDKIEQLVSDGIYFLADTADWETSEPWPSLTADGLRADPLNIQGGASGVLIFLNSVLQSHAPTQLKDAAASLSNPLTEWITTQLSADPRVLPGLYFGRSGTALALIENSAERTVVEAATSALLRAPVRWFSPDITHGISGLGIACLRAYQITKDPRFRQRVQTIANRLTKNARKDGLGVRWVAADSTEGRLAGVSHIGFAHGIAGIGYFLEQAEKEGIVQPSTDLVERIHEELERQSIKQAGGRLWPTGDKGKESIGLSWWCSGSVGVGLYLLNSRKTTKLTERMVHEAALAAWQQRWRLSSSACHGLASTGHFLLDAADYFEDDQYTAMAHEIASSLFTRAGYQRGRLILPGDDLTTVDYSYNTGISGPLSFLTRLLYGGENPMMIPRTRSRSHAH
jgi:hypothetical protein